MSTTTIFHAQDHAEIVAATLLAEVHLARLGALHVAVVARALRLVEPAAAAVVISVRPALEDQARVRLLAVHDATDAELWTDASGQNLTPPDQSSGDDDMRASIEHALATALNYAGPNANGWHSDTTTADEDDTALRIVLPAEAPENQASPPGAEHALAQLTPWTTQLGLRLRLA